MMNDHHMLYFVNTLLQQAEILSLLYVHARVVRLGDIIYALQYNNREMYIAHALNAANRMTHARTRLKKNRLQITNTTHTSISVVRLTVLHDIKFNTIKQFPLFPVLFQRFQFTYVVPPQSSRRSVTHGDYAECNSRNSRTLGH